MQKQLKHALHRLLDSDTRISLCKLQRGLEKESLRIDQHGRLAQTPHPAALGSALTHPYITTDYSEALLELVTPVHTDIERLLENLHHIHHFIYRQLRQEKLWVNSMPCITEGEQSIPIAQYGRSNSARMKEVYRRGLEHRYGKLMQTIAGIHYNFSLPDAFWRQWLPERSQTSMQQRISAQYFGLIRNFHRYSWLICYLFGASPAVCKTFLQGREHSLQALGSHSFFSPYATSLRLSGIGYSNNAQSDIQVCYNSLDAFVHSLRRAIQTSHPEYEKFGTRVNGVYQQLNTNLLQIENEFYAAIRPKRTTRSGESPSVALQQQGVQYIEVRSLDLNPFEAVGIDASCMHFMDILLLTCLLMDSPPIDAKESKIAAENHHRVVVDGRKPGLMLIDADHEKAFVDIAREILAQMRPLAELLDQANTTHAYTDSLTEQYAKIERPELTPSARVLGEMAEKNISFFEFAMQAAEKHERHFKQTTISPAILSAMQKHAAESHLKQHQIESQDSLSFDEFLRDYFERQNAS